MYLQLVYISTMREPLTHPQCSSILAASRSNNRAAGITGLLVAGAKRFLQLLEGPEEAVEVRLDIIRADPRHFALVLLDKRLVATRLCPDWAMGFIPGGEATGGETLSEIVAALAAPIEDSYLRAQFTGFAEIQDRAA
jgi:hypothetical protein